jgi:hypothetical protein
MRTGRPEPGEYAAYAEDDLNQLAGDDAIEVLQASEHEVRQLFAPLTDDDVAGLAYAPGKWTVKEVLAHLIDDERVFAYRALCVARGDTTPLPGFDEKLYAANSGAESRPLQSLLEEYRVVRLATVALLAPLTPEAWLRRGMTNGYSASARGLAFHIAGHEQHHLRILRERYLPGRRSANG